jgi:hypothetical protein
VSTGDNVQRIYVPRDNAGNNESSTGERAKGKDKESGNVSTQQPRDKETTSSDKPTDFRTAKDDYMNRIASNRRDSDSSTSANKTQAISAPTEKDEAALRTPTRAAHRPRENSSTSLSSSSPQSAGRQRHSHQIYSPVGGSMATPSRNEHPVAAHQSRSSNQTPSPGVAFMKRGSQSAGRLGAAADRNSHNPSAQGIPGPPARFHTTTKLDTLKEESADDFSLRSARVDSNGVSCMGTTDGDPGTFKSRRLFNEDNSVTTAHSESIIVDGSSLFCPLCSVLIWDRDSDSSTTITAHIQQVYLILL